ncbi:MAG: hypothetical protein LBQ50_03120 [Planctomycetaceae bacterium]|jgi:hypothetical protein|nr:hypothetical protein [Planctomycetaceae bacterium]
MDAIANGTTAGDTVNLNATNSDGSAWNNVGAAFTLEGVEKFSVSNNATLRTDSKRGTATPTGTETITTETEVAEYVTLTVDSKFFNGGIQEKTDKGMLIVSGGFTTPGEYTSNAGYVEKLHITGGTFELTGSDDDRGYLVVTSTDEDAVKISGGATLKVSEAENSEFPVGIFSASHYNSLGLGSNDKTDNYNIYEDTSPVNITVDNGILEINRSVESAELFAYIGAGGVIVDVAENMNLRIGDVTLTTGITSNAEPIVTKKGKGMWKIEHGFDLRTTTEDDQSFQGVLNVKAGTVVFDAGTTSYMKQLEISGGTVELVGGGSNPGEGATIILPDNDGNNITPDAIYIHGNGTLKINGDNVGLLNPAQAALYSGDYDDSQIHNVPLGMTIDGGTVVVTGDNELIAPGLFLYIGKNGATIDIDDVDTTNGQDRAVVGNVGLVRR